MVIFNWTWEGIVSRGHVCWKFLTVRRMNVWVMLQEKRWTTTLLRVSIFVSYGRALDIGKKWGKVLLRGNLANYYTVENLYCWLLFKFWNNERIFQLFERNFLHRRNSKKKHMTDKGYLNLVFDRIFVFTFASSDAWEWKTDSTLIIVNHSINKRQKKFVLVH